VDDLDAITIDPIAPPSENGAPPADTPSAEGWRLDKRGKQYVPRQGGKPGIIHRQGQETIAEARARDAAGTEKRPRRAKTPKPKMPDAPKRLDSRELEASLTMALKAPGVLAMTLAHDEWLPDHFNMSAPALSRQIILASEHNPWLRRRIEEAATGQDAMWAVISLVGVGTALFGYMVPPLVYIFNPSFVPPSARQRWGMPERPPAYARTPSTAQPEGPPEPFAPATAPPFAA
jgi:hypothetical protein